MKLIFTLFVGAFLVASCSKNNSGEAEKYLPPSSGTHAEMLLVVQDSVWKTALSKSILTVFGREQYGLPQPEAIFSLNRINPSAFTSIFKKSKSIVLIELGDTTMVNVQHDVWASPQMVATIVAPTLRGLYKLIKENEANLTAAFKEADLNVIRGRMAKTAYKTLPASLREMGINKMRLSLGFEQTLDKPDLKIFRQSTKKTEQFILFYTRPMRDDYLPGQDIIAARDTIAKNYFEGPKSGSYFATEVEMPPQQLTLEIDGQFAIETRGLWRTVGGFMGGPFLSYTIYNDKTNQVLCVEGFFYGPDAKKRNILLEMEAMMRSIEWKK
jgi:hypothetical protein